MTIKKLRQIIEENNIPEDATLMSDSGWECCATDMDCVYYSKIDNIIVFTQCFYEEEHYDVSKKWRLLYGVDFDGNEVTE
jgi:hypothetical protein